MHSVGQPQIENYLNLSNEGEFMTNLRMTVLSLLAVAGLLAAKPVSAQYVKSFDICAALKAKGMTDPYWLSLYGCR